MTDAPPACTAVEVPAMRRELAEWFGSDNGPRFYLQAIVAGQQPIRPAGPPPVVAAQLAAGEHTRLRDGDLWYIDQDMCALVQAAYPTMPEFAPRPQDLPSPSGFVVFADPIGAYDKNTTRTGFSDALTASTPGADRLWDGQIQIVAASWGPYNVPGWKAGGVWMSFYSASGLSSLDGHVNADVLRRAMSGMPPLTLDNEFVVAWRPDGEPPDRYMLLADAQGTTMAWARMLLAAFQLAAQEGLATTDRERAPRPERRRTERAGLPERDVRVVRLRRGTGSGGSGDGAGREYRHRWAVRGHWRNQWYATIQDHRPKWIMPHVKGPDGAPLIGGEKVGLVSVPVQPRGGPGVGADR